MPAPAAETSSYPELTVGRLMEPPIAVFPPGLTVAAATEQVRQLAAQRLFTYAYVKDDAGVLLGVITMRDLLLHEKDERLGDFMLRQPFALRPDMTLMDAIRQTVNKHFPAYPVCNEQGVLVGIVRGSKLFEQQTIEISAQAGSMVGVEKEERVGTTLLQSLKFRHPWLQFHPSAGSIFRKIEGVGAGRLIDQLGMKGHRIGGAQISHIHANIMVNLGGATARDVRELIALAQQRVKDERGQELTPEISFVGEF